MEWPRIPYRNKGPTSLFHSVGCVWRCCGACDVDISDLVRGKKNDRQIVVLVESSSQNRAYIDGVLRNDPFGRHFDARLVPQPG